MDMDDVINTAPERLLSNGYTEYFSYEGRKFKKGNYIVFLLFSNIFVFKMDIDEHLITIATSSSCQSSDVFRIIGVPFGKLLDVMCRCDENEIMRFLINYCVNDTLKVLE